MAKYSILEEPKVTKMEGKQGAIYKVALIPEVENSEALTEVQEYFVSDDAEAHDILSKAAKHHEAQLKTAPEQAVFENPAIVKAT